MFAGVSASLFALSIIMSAFRKPLIGGNWKCNGTVSQVASLTEQINTYSVPANCEVVIAVPTIHLAHCKANFPATVSVAAQDVSIMSGYGAYTGECTADMLKDSGINWAVIGHSERRTGFGYPGESNEVVAAKVKKAIGSGMEVIACIGEDLSEREAGTTLDVCGAQLQALANILSPEEWGHVVIAYEPKWAIGTGKVATPEQAEETHRGCREWLASHVSAEVAASTRILYGGSVKANNCQTLIACPNIDGFLVGGASLLPEFADIIKSAQQSA